MTEDQINNLLNLILPTDADHAVRALIQLVEVIANEPDANERELLSLAIAQAAFARTAACRDAMESFINASTEPGAERAG